MKKAVLLVSLAIMTVSVWGMNGSNRNHYNYRKYNVGNSNRNDSNRNLKRGKSDYHYDKQEFYRAINEANVYGVRHILDKKKGLVNIRDGGGWTPLHKIAFKQYNGETAENYLEIAKLLLQYGADINAVTSKFKETPLHIAVTQGNSKIVDLLLAQKDIDIDAINKGGWTALHIAINKGFDEIVKLLLDKGADCRSFTWGVDNKGKKVKNSYLYMAVSSGNFESVRLLLDKNDEGGNRLFDIDDKNSSGWTALHKAIYEGFDEIVKLLLDKGADCSLFVEGVNFEGKKIESSCLHMAVSSGNFETVRLLLEKNGENGGRLFDIDAKDSNGFTALHKAIAGGFYEIVEKLLEEGADCALVQEGIDNKGKEVKSNCLSMAVISKDLGIVDLLLKQKDEEGNRLLDIDAKDGKGWTALHIAISNGLDGIVNLLLKNGADHTLTLDREDSRGCLHMAVISGDLKTVRLLLEQKDENGIPLFDINAKNSGGWTPLMMAAKEGNLKILNLLIDKGANLLEQDSNGNTALIQAMVSKKIKNEKTRLKIIDKLIETAPNIIICPDNKGKNALQKASAGMSNPEYQKKDTLIFQKLRKKALDAGLFR